MFGRCTVFLKRDTGISIPCDSMSYLEPIMSSKLWNEVAKFKERKHFETPYVVKIHNYASLGETKLCFRFVHPNWSERIDNRRFVKLEFKIRCDATLHGFAGYFHSNLFGEHAISINPATFSEGMFSWFPIYFPIRNPMYVRKGEVVQVHMWRCVSSKKVWYVVLVFDIVYFSHKYNKFTGRVGRFYIDGQDTDSQSARSVVLDWIVIVIFIYMRTIINFSEDNGA